MDVKKILIGNKMFKQRRESSRKKGSQSDIYHLMKFERIFPQKVDSFFVFNYSCDLNQLVLD